MAELVNQRIEDMINELEQMRRTQLFDDEEIREIARKRKEFEYKIQRRVKSKEDFVHYIAYELALLQDISLRRQQNKLGELKKDLEYAIAKRLNKLFKQFIYRFQNDIEVYFQYIKFCQSVGFNYAVSGIIGQMLQNYGDKPKMWQMASKWEMKEQENKDHARDFLLKGLHRHPEADFLYIDLFNIELLLAFKAKTDDDKVKQINRAEVVWKNCVKNVDDVKVLFKLLDVSQKYELAESITKGIKDEIWSRNSDKEVWPFIAYKELEECHWEELEEFVDDALTYPDNLKYFICTYREALQRFPDEKLCTKYIHDLLGVDEHLCSGIQKLNVVKNAWMFGHEQGVLSNDMYAFGIQVLKLENELTKDELLEILDSAISKNPSAKYLWEEKLLLCKPDEKKMVSILQEASRSLKSDDTLHLWNLILDNIETGESVKNLYKKFQKCESPILMAVKPKLLQKMYEHSGIKSARQMYEEFIRTPPIQLELHTTMIEIENKQDPLNIKQIRKCYECLVQHHGKDYIEIWMNYMKFEISKGSAQFSPALYRRAIQTLKKELVDEFIKGQTLTKING